MTTRLWELSLTDSPVGKYETSNKKIKVNNKGYAKWNMKPEQKDLELPRPKQFCLDGNTTLHVWITQPNYMLSPLPIPPYSASMLPPFSPPGCQITTSVLSLHHLPHQLHPPSSSHPFFGPLVSPLNNAQTHWHISLLCTTFLWLPHHLTHNYLPKLTTITNKLWIFQTPQKVWCVCARKRDSIVWSWGSKR